MMDRDFQYRTWERGQEGKEPKTLSARVIRFLLIGLNMQEVPSRSRKYRQFKSSKPENTNQYFVGKAGAVRAGKTSSDSFSITATVHANMKLWERRNAQ